jgi:ribonuclease HII
MNALTVAAQARAVSQVLPDDAAATADATVVVDAGDVNETRCADRVRAGLSGEPTVRAEHGADETYPVVGAASIVAKVERDAAMERLAEEYGPVGSGYPSDSTTREFLADYVAEHGALPPFARESWKTCQDTLAGAQSSLDAFEE